MHDYIDNSSLVYAGISYPRSHAVRIDSAHAFTAGINHRPLLHH
jgi:hypothetical protein